MTKKKQTFFYPLQHNESILEGSGGKTAKTNFSSLLPSKEMFPQFTVQNKFFETFQLKKQKQLVRWLAFLPNSLTCDMLGNVQHSSGSL